MLSISLGVIFSALSNANDSLAFSICFNNFSFFSISSLFSGVFCIKSNCISSSLESSNLFSFSFCFLALYSSAFTSALSIIDFILLEISFLYFSDSSLDKPSALNILVLILSISSLAKSINIGSLISLIIL